MTEYTAVYAVVTLDMRDDVLKRSTRTPAIFTSYQDAEDAIKNDTSFISEDGTNLYALVEETHLNQVYPDSKVIKWFMWDAIAEEYRPCETPKYFLRIVGFSIG